MILLSPESRQFFQLSALLQKRFRFVFPPLEKGGQGGFDFNAPILKNSILQSGVSLSPSSPIFKN